MNKAQLVQDVSERLEIRRQEAADAVEAVIEAITERVAAGERVAISGFGIFEQVFRKDRVGRNPRTGETVRIGAVTLPKFRPGRDFRNLVAGVREAVGHGDAAAEEAPQESVNTPTAPAKNAPAAKETPAKKAPAAKKTAAKKAPPAKKTAAKKAPAAKKTAAKKAPAAKKTAAKKAPAAKPSTS